MEKDGKKKKRHVGLLILAAILLVLLAAAVIIYAMYIRETVYVPDKYEAPPTPTPEVSGAPEPTPYVKRTPVMMYFTKKKISFPIETVGIIPYTDKEGNVIKDEDGETVYTMDTADSAKVAAWLEDSASPGEYGNAIFTGHSSFRHVAGVFSVLPDMRVGEEIIVKYDDGSTMAFIVTSVYIRSIYDMPENVMKYDTGDSRMTLNTDYGESWNSGLGTRNQRCVVIAKPKDKSQIIMPPADE